MSLNILRSEIPDAAVQVVGSVGQRPSDLNLTRTGYEWLSLTAPRGACAVFGLSVDPSECDSLIAQRPPAEPLFSVSIPDVATIFGLIRAQTRPNSPHHLPPTPPFRRTDLKLIPILGEAGSS